MAAREGKTKRLTPRPDGLLAVEFKSTATAFNAAKKAEVEGKGTLNASISAMLFEYVEAHGVKTCFHARGEAPNVLLYHPLEMLPVEVIVRNQAYGSFCKRFPFVEMGHTFTEPLVEFCLKDDALGDPPLPDDALNALQLIPESLNVQTLKALARKVNDLFQTLFRECGICCADFKLEFGLDADATLVLADELSPDNFRLRDAKTGTVLDKDVFRLDLGDLATAYQEVLARLQNEKERRGASV